MNEWSAAYFAKMREEHERKTRAAAAAKVASVPSETGQQEQ